MIQLGGLDQECTHEIEMYGLIRARGTTSPESEVSVYVGDRTDLQFLIKKPYKIYLKMPKIFSHLYITNLNPLSSDLLGAEDNKKLNIANKV